MSELRLEFIDFTKEEADELREISSCMEKYDFVNPGTISIKKVSKKEIARLNESYSGEKKLTDVLSFSYQEIEGIEPPNDAALGDIAICEEIANEQARALQIPLIDEYGFLTVHGLLHIFGFDHLSSEDQRAMKKLQDEIMQRCGFTERHVSWQ